MTNDEYRGLKGVNYSTLKYIDISPKHYRAAVDHGVAEKSGWALGRVAHVATLEPYSWANRYIIQPDTVKRTEKSGKTKLVQLKRDDRMPEWVELKQKAAEEGREIITKAEHDAAVAISRAVLLDPCASELFRQQPRTEVPIVWRSTNCGVMLKSRLDMGCPAFVADLKTSVDIRLDKVFRSFVTYDYLAQFAMYADAWHYETGEFSPFKVVVVQKSSPFDVVVVNLTEEHLEFGRKRYESWLQLLQRCLDSDQWPGVSGGAAVTFELPAWAAANDGDDCELIIGGERVAI